MTFAMTARGETEANVKSTALVIRRARPDETGVVYSLIRELAEYEKLSHEVEASETMIAAALFGANPILFCDIAEWDGEVAGFAVWFKNFSTFSGRAGIYLEDLFVRPSLRGKGIGKALLAHLAQRCVDEGLARLEWAVLDWNAPAIGFYDRLGAEAKTEWITRRLSGEALRRLASG